MTTLRALLLCAGLWLMTSTAAIAKPYAVDPIKQPSIMSCWAAATTMLVNWKTGIKRPIKDVVSMAGPNFVKIYNDSFANPPLGILPPDEAAFYRKLGLKVIQGMNPSIPGWKKLLKENGPLSITVDSDPGKGYIHALVVTGVDGDDTATGTIVTYIDPADGMNHDVSFANFLKLYEGSAKWPLQIIHF